MLRETLDLSKFRWVINDFLRIYRRLNYRRPKKEKRETNTFQDNKGDRTLTGWWISWNERNESEKFV